MCMERVESMSVQRACMGHVEGACMECGRRTCTEHAHVMYV